MSEPVLNTEAAELFSVALEEAARADESGIERFIEPAAGTLLRAQSNRHHLIFGRRGSGKTSLLQKARAELIAERRPNAFIDMEKFKKHTYPDVLISVLIEAFGSMSEWLDLGAVAPANKKSFWHRIRPRRKPLKRSEASLLRQQLDEHIAELRALLFAQDGASIESLRRGEMQTSESAQGEAGAEIPQVVSAKVASALTTTETTGEEVKESIKRSKTDFLHRRILDYQATLRGIVALSGQNGFVMLDDLYYIRRADQPDVLNYFHRMFKGSGLWLKVGTIRHRSEWYRHGDPPVGIKLGDDVEEIDLDLTLEKYKTAKAFLQKIASQIGASAGLTLTHLVNEGARDRLVVASGGVARDYIAILRKSISIAREDDENFVTVASVNKASGEHESTKRDEFRRDVVDGAGELDQEFEQIKKFCFKNDLNCFTVEKDLGTEQYRRIKELVDLRLVHAVQSRVTVRHRPGRIYEGYMLDLSQYSGARLRRGLQILEFWKTPDDEKLRLATLIFAEGP